jgi:small subunit ribosomal protein S15
MVGSYRKHGSTPPETPAHELILDELIQRISNTLEGRHHDVINPTSSSSVSQKETFILEKDPEPSPDFSVGHFRLPDLLQRHQATHKASIAISKVNHKEIYATLPPYFDGITTRDFQELSDVSGVMQQLISMNMATAREMRQARALILMNQFRTRSNDTGRTEVQIAALTARLDNMMAHLQDHKKDFRTKRCIYLLVQRRRLLLKYLRQQHLERYATTCRFLGIRQPKERHPYDRGAIKKAK